MYLTPVDTINMDKTVTIRKVSDFGGSESFNQNQVNKSDDHRTMKTTKDHAPPLTRRGASPNLAVLSTWGSSLAALFTSTKKITYL